MEEPEESDSDAADDSDGDEGDDQFPRNLTPAERAMEMALMGQDYWGKQKSAEHWATRRKLLKAVFDRESRAPR